MNWLNAILQGSLLGGTYAMAAAGLALVFGIMRIINMAHGDIIVASAFLAQVIASALGVNLLVAGVITIPLVAAGGYGLQRWLVNPTVSSKDPLPALILTFGLSIVLQNLLVMAFSANSRRLDIGGIDAASLPILPGLSIGVLPLIAFAISAFSLLALHGIFYRTAMGRAFRATAADTEIARLMGLDTGHVYAMVAAIAFGFAALSGLFMGIFTSFDPFVGPTRLITAFEVIVIGGLGSIYGALVGGVLLGIAQAIGAQIDPALQQMMGHIVFLAVIALRPNGLFSRSAA